jgi:hypothetical protein
MPHFPALNEVTRQTGTEEPKYPDNADDLRYMVLYPEDYEGHGVDVEGNVALLLDEENAREVRRIADDIIDQLEDDE